MLIFSCEKEAIRDDFIGTFTKIVDHGDNWQRGESSAGMDDSEMANQLLPG